MIAYLQGRDTAIDVPDDIGDKELSDIQKNFSSYVEPSSTSTEPTAPAARPQQPGAPEALPTQEAPATRWKPDFYESHIKPMLTAIGPMALPVMMGDTPEGRTATGKFFEGATFGLTKSITPDFMEQEYKDHPVYATAGEFAGSIGSLLATGGALRIAGLGVKAAEVGTVTVKAGFAAGSRVIPPAIMSGATFGTKTFIDKTVKAFQDGNVDLVDFGRSVIKDTALGGLLGGISGVANAAAAISSAAGLGFVSAKMDGADNADAALSAGIWGAFETVGSFGREARLRGEALKTLSDTIGEYVQAKNPAMAPGMAKAVGDAVVEQAAGRVGGLDVVVKSQEDTLGLIEDINQKVLQGKVRLEPAVKPSEAPALEEGKPSPEGETLSPRGPQPQGPSPTELTPPAYQGSPLNEELRNTIFPPTEVSSQERISAHPDFVKISNDATAIVSHYAALRGVEPTNEVARSLHTEFHDVLGQIQKAGREGGIEAAKQVAAEIKKQYPDIQNEFSTLRDKLWSDDMDIYFGKNVAGKYGAMRPKVAIEAEGMPALPKEKPVKYDEAGLPILNPKSVVSTVTTPDGETAKITHKDILDAAQDMLDAARSQREGTDAIGQFVRDMGGILGFKGGAADEMAQMAYDRGLLEEPNADLLRNHLESIAPRRAEPKLADFYPEAQRELEDFFANVPASEQQAGNFSLSPTPSENVMERYNRLISQAMSQGLTRPQAVKWARGQMSGKPSGIAQEPKPKQQEFGETGGVKSFGKGREGEQELSFSQSPGKTRGMEEGKGAGRSLPPENVPQRPGEKQAEVDHFKDSFGARTIEEVDAALQRAEGSRNAKGVFIWKESVPSVGFRIGTIPKTGQSYNAREQHFENGVSLVSAGNLPSIKSFAISDLRDSGAQIVYVRGKVNTHLGGDDEFVMRDAVEISKAEYEKSLASPDQHLSDYVMSGYRWDLSGRTGGDVSRWKEANKSAEAKIKALYHSSFNPSSPATSGGDFSMAGLPAEPLPKAPPKTPKLEVIHPDEENEVVSRLKESGDEIRNLIAPAKAAPLAAEIFRENLGKMARSYDMADAALEDARRLFDREPKELAIAFIDKLEHGQEQEDPRLNEVSKILRNLLDAKRKEIQALGTGKLKEVIENYFPHIWEQGEKKVNQAVQKAAKRPLQGSKSFLKKRKIEYFKEGLEMGLTPVSYNPVDLTLLKIREMDKYLNAHRTIQEYKASGLAKYVKVGQDAPEGWTKINDSISTVFKSPMVAVKEAYDEELVSRMNEVAKNLGIDLERKVKIGKKGVHSDIWGYSESDAVKSGTPGKITTRFGGPESVIAHELGHQIDHIYGLQQQFLFFNSPTEEAEFTALAKERIPKEGASEQFKNYIQKAEERMAVMLESYIHAPDLFKKVAPAIYGKFEAFLKSKPELAPLTEIKPSLVMGVNESEVYAGGNVIAGHIWAQPDAARIINNYLSPGLQKSAIYQAYRTAANALNQFQLGFSAFHLGFTSVDAMVSKLALAINQLALGHPLRSIEAALKTPFAPISNITRGDRLLNAWRGKGIAAIDNVLAEAMASAGGRARMDQFYATMVADKVKNAFKAGRTVRGILHIPMLIAEMSSKPILEWIVPRQKLGVFADLMLMEMKHNPNMTHEELRSIAQRAWDSVDNRMGQLVYDNLFWNRVFKDLLMASVRSVGWNLGTIREVGGGVADLLSAPAKMAKGEKRTFSYRSAYVIALPILAGIGGAIYQYLRTGKGPEELKDYFFPKTGGTDANGDPTRAALPTYMKDLYHYTQAPVKTITNKINPILSVMGQMLENKDFYNVRIRNEDDPIVKQVAAEAAFMLKQFEPFGLRNYRRNAELGDRSLADIVGPWVGITPAPYDVNQSKAEKVAHEIASEKVPIGGKTQEQADRRKILNDLGRRYRLGDPNARMDMMSAFQAGKISAQQMRDVILTSRMTPLQRITNSFSFDELRRVYQAATPEEKAELGIMMRRKEISAKRGFVQQASE